VLVLAHDSLGWPAHWTWPRLAAAAAVVVVAAAAAVSAVGVVGGHAVVGMGAGLGCFELGVVGGERKDRWRMTKLRCIVHTALFVGLVPKPR
jgi:hypothetical protein